MKTRVLIAIPTFESIKNETFKSIYGLNIPENTEVMFDFVKGYDCAKARNEIAKIALNYGFDYVLMVDSDIILPNDTLTNLLSWKKEVVLGWYPRKRDDEGKTEVFKLGERDFTDSNNYNKKELENVDDLIAVKGGGLGCALINCDVFEKLEFPYFYYMLYNNGLVLSEDNYFAVKCTNKGISIYCDTRVGCNHIYDVIV